MPKTPLAWSNILDPAQVYTLEKVLVMQKDVTNGRSFLDEAMLVLENKPSASFWSTLARTLERSCREGVKSEIMLC
jgi:conserved oligomeric Golgi complex subunit 5